MAYFDINNWVIDLIDEKIKVKSVKVVCDENGDLICGFAVDEKGNKVLLSYHNVRIIVEEFAAKERIPSSRFIQLRCHSIFQFIRIKKCDLIKEMHVIIDKKSNNIYKMLIVDSNGKRRYVVDSEEQKSLLESFAIQHAVTVDELQNINLIGLDITRVHPIITNIDVVTDEWSLSTGSAIEKIIVTTSDGKKKEYSDIEGIRKVLISLCRQEYAESQSFAKCMGKLERAYRSDFLECVGNLPLINIIKPIYEQIEIIERSFDHHMLPTKVRVITSNHGSQVYDLVNGVIVSDTNVKSGNIFQRMRNFGNSHIASENDEVYEMAKQISLLLKFMPQGEYELEQSFFVSYFAEQQLAQEGISRMSIGVSRFEEELEKRKRIIASDKTKVISSFDYESIEILKSTSDSTGQRKIFKIRVKTSNGSFIIDGYGECLRFIKKFALIKKMDVDTLFKDSQYIIDVSNQSKDSFQIESSDRIERSGKQNLTFGSFFGEHIKEFLKKFKLCRFSLGNIEEKKVRR